MKPENKVVAVILSAFAVVVAFGGAYLLTTSQPLPASLPILAGTEIDHAEYNVSFTVVGGLGRLTGAWYADHGGLIWIYPSNSPPCGIYNLPCISSAP
jgi:hypothetical protein